jgi:hypothetical protein
MVDQILDNAFSKDYLIPKVIKKGQFLLPMNLRTRKYFSFANLSYARSFPRPYLEVIICAINHKTRR